MFRQAIAALNIQIHGGDFSAFDGVQRSTRYPGGVALRFARVLRYRPDKRPDEVDTIETVRSFSL